MKYSPEEISEAQNKETGASSEISRQTYSTHCEKTKDHYSYL
jgi:hypothetical protein